MFADYLNTAGPRRATLVSQHMDRLDGPPSEAHIMYGPAEDAIIEAFGSADPAAVLEEMVRTAHYSRRGHYQALADGTAKLIKKHGYKLAPEQPRPGLWVSGRMRVKTNHLVALRDRKGNELLCHLYFKEATLESDTVDSIIRMIETQDEASRPKTAIAVLDVRRSKLRKRRERLRPAARVDAWLKSEAVSYVDLWDSLRTSSADS